MIYLHKIIPWFFLPLGLIVIFFLLFLIFKKKIFFLISFFLLFIFSNNFLADNFFSIIEGSYTNVELKNIPNSEAVVILSGMTSRIYNNNKFFDEWSDPDRFFAGLKLIKNNKSKKLIFTNSLLPWEKNFRSEGDILRDKAIDLGIPESKIFLTNIVHNTEDESKSLKNILDDKSKIILVTSAFHMKRAKFLVEKNGYEVFPYPVDFKVHQSRLNLIYYLPDLKAMSLFTIGLNELYGRIYYFYIKRRT